MHQFSRPLAPAKAVFCFLSEPNIPEDQNMKKYEHYILMHGEKLYQLHTETTTAVVTSKYLTGVLLSSQFDADLGEGTRLLNNLEKRILQKYREPTILETEVVLLEDLDYFRNGVCQINHQSP